LQKLKEVVVFIVSGLVPRFGNVTLKINMIKVSESETPVYYFGNGFCFLDRIVFVDFVSFVFLRVEFSVFLLTIGSKIFTFLFILVFI